MQASKESCSRTRLIVQIIDSRNQAIALKTLNERYRDLSLIDDSMAVTTLDISNPKRRIILAQLHPEVRRSCTMLGRERSLPATLLLLTCCLIQPTKIIAIGFTSPKIYASGSKPAGIATDDFNKDGKLDICVANSGVLNITILLGRGDGTFLTAVNYKVPQAPESIAVSDFNHDGNLDVVVANAGSISVLLGNGNGIFKRVLTRAAAQHLALLRLETSTVMASQIWLSVTAIT